MIYLGVGHTMGDILGCGSGGEASHVGGDVRQGAEGRHVGATDVDDW